MAIIKEKKLGSYHARVPSLYDGTSALDQLAYRGNTMETAFRAIKDRRNPTAKEVNLPFLIEPESK
jgi:hypothetical protein